MAAYAYSVDVDQDRANRLHDSNFAILSGSVNLTNYNATTKPEITEIAGKFRRVTRVVFSISDGGYAFEWDDDNNTIVAYSSGGTSGAALAEEATDTDVGKANFIAIGQV